MAGEMKTFVSTAPGEFEIRSVPIPSPGHGQALLRVTAVTTCPQWDLHLRHNEPMFVGHRFVYRPKDRVLYIDAVERRSMVQHVQRLLRQDRIEEVDPGRYLTRVS